jgi:hypothetical protein
MVRGGAGGGGGMSHSSRGGESYRSQKSAIGGGGGKGGGAGHEAVEGTLRGLPLMVLRECVLAMDHRRGAVSYRSARSTASHGSDASDGSSTSVTRLTEDELIRRLAGVLSSQRPILLTKPLCC